MRMALSKVTAVKPDLFATANLSIETGGQGFYDITSQVRQFVSAAAARDGVVFLYMRHTSASLVIQENADPDVRVDLMTALERLAPSDAGWIHDAEGPDDMPAHVKTMLTSISLHIPVVDGVLGLGAWQGIYLVEHRTRAHTRDIVLQCVGCSR